MKTNKNKKQAKGKAPTTKKSTVKPATTKKQNKLTTTATKAKSQYLKNREIKVGDKIVEGGEVGVVKKLSVDKGPFGSDIHYAVIEFKRNGKPVQRGSSIDYLQQAERQGEIKITTPRKTASKPTTKKATTDKTKMPTVKTSTVSKQSTKSKLKQANELRRKTVSTDNACNRIINNWQSKVQGKSLSERTKIDDTYNQRIQQAEERSDKAYKEYYDFVKNNFSAEQVTAAKPYGSFTDKSFIDRLEKTTKTKSHVAGVRCNNNAKEPKLPTTKQPAKNASNQKQATKQSQKQEEGDKPSHPQGEQRKSSVGVKKPKRKNVSQNVPNGTIIHSNDKFFENADGLSDKGRYAVVVDSNRDDELAVVKTTHSPKEPSHKLTVLDGKSKVLPGGLSTNDMTKKPIKINGRFVEKPSKGLVSEHEVNDIKIMLINDPCFGKRNRQKLHKLKKRQ